ncbi:MAG: hypothetical protein H6699_07700 [Myxococcales bacterium]|nr:hypothetical protein [Myxococcales bacterium]
MKEPISALLLGLLLVAPSVVSCDRAVSCETREDCPWIRIDQLPFDCAAGKCVRRECTDAYDCFLAGLSTAAGCESDGICVDCTGACGGHGACACPPDDSDGESDTADSDAPDTVIDEAGDESEPDSSDVPDGSGSDSEPDSADIPDGSGSDSEPDSADVPDGSGSDSEPDEGSG